MKRLLCLIRHDEQKRIILNVIGPDMDDPTVLHTRLTEKHICKRCGRKRSTEEIIPLQYVVSDD